MTRRTAALGVALAGLLVPVATAHTLSSQRAHDRANRAGDKIEVVYNANKEPTWHIELRSGDTTCAGDGGAITYGRAVAASHRHSVSCQLTFRREKYDNDHLEPIKTGTCLLTVRVFFKKGTSKLGVAYAGHFDECHNVRGR
jgi:hypothetical protein